MSVPDVLAEIQPIGLRIPMRGYESGCTTRGASPYPVTNPHEGL